MDDPYITSHIRTAAFILENPGALAVDCARALGVTAPTILRHLSRLRKDGVIVRDRPKHNYINPHARQWVLSIVTVPQFPTGDITIGEDAKVRGVYVPTPEELKEIRRGAVLNKYG